MHHYFWCLVRGCFQNGAFLLHPPWGGTLFLIWQKNERIKEETDSQKFFQKALNLPMKMESLWPNHILKFPSLNTVTKTVTFSTYILERTNIEKIAMGGIKQE
jgi:hypothetical protein